MLRRAASHTDVAAMVALRQCSVVSWSGMYPSPQIVAVSSSDPFWHTEDLCVCGVFIATQMGSTAAETLPKNIWNWMSMSHRRCCLQSHSCVSRSVESFGHPVYFRVSFECTAILRPPLTFSACAKETLFTKNQNRSLFSNLQFIHGESCANQLTSLPLFFDITRASSILERARTKTKQPPTRISLYPRKSPRRSVGKGHLKQTNLAY